ncbi:hypothetical protein BDR22DRAFT_919794 [Usnea florida]
MGLAKSYQLSDSQTRTKTEFSSFGLINITRKTVEGIRDQDPSGIRDQDPSGGLIQKATSTGGLGGNIYTPIEYQYLVSTTPLNKWAVEYFTKALSHQVNPEQKIHFLYVEPGGLHIDLVERSIDFSAHRHLAYNCANVKEAMAKRNGSRAGDVVKGVKVMY